MTAKLPRILKPHCPTCDFRGWWFGCTHHKSRDAPITSIYFSFMHYSKPSDAAQRARDGVREPYGKTPHPKESFLAGHRGNIQPPRAK